MFVIDTEKFRDSYHQLLLTEPGISEYKDDMRIRLAEANNCIAIGNESCYADMVAIPKEYPSVVIKICSGDDAFINYAHLCYRGELKGKHFLKIFSEAEIASGVWLFVLERLDKHLEEEFYNNTVDEITYGMSSHDNENIPLYEVRKSLDEAVNTLKQVFQKNKISFCKDLHKGNVMQRKDGTIVFIDPVC